MHTERMYSHYDCTRTTDHSRIELYYKVSTTMLQNNMKMREVHCASSVVPACGLRKIYRQNTTRTHARVSSFLVKLCPILNPLTKLLAPRQPFLPVSNSVLGFCTKLLHYRRWWSKPKTHYMHSIGVSVSLSLCLFLHASVSSSVCR